MKIFFNGCLKVKVKDNNYILKLIKIDCEGEEINILKGSINTIKKSQPVLIIEENKDKNKIIKYLKNYGYFFIKISNSRNIIFLKKNEYNSIIKKLSLLNINIDSMLKN